MKIIGAGSFLLATHLLSLVWRMVHRIPVPCAEDLPIGAVYAFSLGPHQLG